MFDTGFFFVLLKDRTCLPLWGPQRASGTLPSGRSPLPLRSVLDGAHWAPGPEPAGETVSRRWRDGRGFFPKDSLPLTPSHARTLQKEGGALAREGETILYISFQRGCAPLEPQGHGCPRFLFCTPKRPDLPPPMGAQVASGHRSAPVSAPAPVGPGRAPLGRRTRTGRRDGVIAGR